MSFLWNGLTDTGSVVPIQVDAQGRVVAVDGSQPTPPDPGTFSTAWGYTSATGATNYGFNLTGVRSDVGVYTYTFDNPVSSDEYVVVGSDQQTGSGGSNSYVVGVSGRSTTGFTVVTRAGSGALADRSHGVVVHGPTP